MQGRPGSCGVWTLAGFLGDNSAAAGSSRQQQALPFLPARPLWEDGLSQAAPDSNSCVNPAVISLAEASLCSPGLGGAPVPSPPVPGWGHLLLRLVSSDPLFLTYGDPPALRARPGTVHTA